MGWGPRDYALAFFVAFFFVVFFAAFFFAAILIRRLPKSKINSKERKREINLLSAHLSQN